MKPRLPEFRGTYRDNGFALRFRESGQGEEILFLHGAGLPTATFRENIEMLSRRYRVITPDIPGYDDSSFPGPGWDFEDYARLYHGFIRARGYRIVLIVGYSFGGGIALHLAPRLDSLRRLVLLSPAGKPVGFRRLGLLRRIVGEGIRGWRCARKAGRPEIFARIARDFLLNGLKRPLRQRAVFALTLRCLNGGADFSAVTTRAHIASVDGDRFFVPRSGEALAREMPHAAWTLKRGTHLWPLIDHPEVERFLLGVGG